MFEAVSAFLVVLSVGILVAHTLDAFRSQGDLYLPNSMTRRWFAQLGSKVPLVPKKEVSQAWRSRDLNVWTHVPDQQGTSEVLLVISKGRRDAFRVRCANRLTATADIANDRHR